MIEQLKEWDTRALLYFNQFHTDWLDPIVFQLTKTEIWIPLYAMLIFLVFKNYKKEGWFVLLGVAVTILLADRITSGLMKPYFARLRPSNELALQPYLHLVNDYHGGLYGFASSHAANTTGVAFILFLLLRTRYRWAWLIFAWALVMSYTRVYLGVHYPGDILAGAAIGIGSGYAGYGCFRWMRNRFGKSQKTGTAD